MFPKRRLHEALSGASHDTTDRQHQFCAASRKRQAVVESLRARRRTTGPSARIWTSGARVPRVNALAVLPVHELFLAGFSLRGSMMRASLMGVCGLSRRNASHSNERRDDEYNEISHALSSHYCFGWARAHTGIITPFASRRKWRMEDAHSIANALCRVSSKRAAETPPGSPERRPGDHQPEDSHQP